MERTQHVFLHSLLQTNLICNLIVKNLVNIFSVNIIISLIGSRCHSKPQLWCEIVHHLLVCVGRAVVRLISVCQNRSKKFFCYFFDGRNTLFLYGILNAYICKVISLLLRIKSSFHCLDSV